MRTASSGWPRSGRGQPGTGWVAAALAVALSASAAPTWAGSAATEPAAAVEGVQRGWTVLHCGVARGVLYLTYAVDGHAAITPAVDNPAIRARCAQAGYPLASAPGGRGAQNPQPVAVAPLTGARPAPPQMPPRLPTIQPPPSFTAQAVGSTVTVDARNDSDSAQSCTVVTTVTWDGNPGAPRSATAQMTLPAHQHSRVVFDSLPGSGARFVTPPTTVCRPLD